MDDLLDEMKRCRTVRACVELALTDARGEDEEAVAWLTCIETMFDRFDRAVVLGQEVELKGFDLANGTAIVAVCRQGGTTARVALESVQFPGLSAVEARWLEAWRQFAGRAG